MRFINPRLHGFLDYPVAGALICVPVLLGFAAYSMPAAVISVAAGIGLVVYSLLTDYSAGIRSLISWRMHLALDAIAAVALVAAPFLLEFGGFARGFYLTIGIAVLGVVATTQLETDEGPEGASSTRAPGVVA